MPPNQDPNAANTVTPGGTGGGPTINSSVLSPVTPASFVTPNPTPIPSVDGLDASGNLTLTAPQKTASDLTKNIEDLNNEMVGKAAFTTDQENAAGIPGLTKQQQDLSTQLTQLKNEAAAIPNQLQLEATGRGITTGGLAPIQTARLRTNSIAALGVSAMLDATNGLLASANDKVTRAVSAKYDPIQEQIDAATKNLQLIMNSPDYTTAEKNQAAAQLKVQQQNQAQLDQQKQDQTDVYNVALEAAKNGADAVTLQKIMNSASPQEAIANAGTSLQAPTKLDTSVQDVNGQKVLIDNQTGETIKVLGPSTATGGPNDSITLTDSSGNPVSVPADVAPYYNTSYSGVGYADLSNIQGTAAEKKQIVDQAQAAGVKVILNKNTAADLSNISDANNKLDTISQIMSTIDQPGALSRALYGIGLTKLATLTQSNPQQAAASSLQSVGLDMLKAISGIQGFRGNASVVQQINDHLPTIYDTDAVAQQKIDYIRQLISDRENGILGVTKAKSQATYNGITLPGGSSNSGSTYNGITLPN